MSILGIDYGKKKIGLALSEGSLAMPYKVLRVLSRQDAVRKITDMARGEGIDKIVIGVSGQKKQEEREIIGELKAVLAIPIETWDETLTTQEAQNLAIKAGIPRKKRKRMEDAFAAALMLQSYLDAH